MNSFKRSLFGYRRPEVDAAISARDVEIAGLEQRTAEQAAAIGSFEGEMAQMSGMVIEREREIRTLGERLREANECHDRSIASLDAVSARLEDLQAQARGQATRIRMKALREAVEVSKRVEALSDAEALEADGDEPLGEGKSDAEGEGLAKPADEPSAATSDPEPATNGNGNGSANGNGHSLYAGKVKLEIGPLGDFSQLVGFEDAVGKAGASDISVERFSEGRATLSMRLEEPTDLLRELEDLSALDFKVRHTAPDNLVLDVDEDDPEARAA
jgi:uncharacterized coiled-coil protein SlyX